MDEEERIPLSLLSQAGYCLRRAALVDTERLWADSADTAKGSDEHRNVHRQRIERRGNTLLLYEYEVFSDRLGIGGKCDTIEAVRDETGCRIPAVDFPVRLYPVEQKHGKMRNETEYEIQLCAQAMCLEDMYQTEIPEGALFYASSHRHKAIALTQELRNLVRNTIEQVADLRKTYVVPPAISGPRCIRCSMRELCLPDMQTSAKAYCSRLMQEAMEVQDT